MKAGLPVAHRSGGHLPKGSWFSKFSAAAAHVAGKPIAFLLASLAIVVWALTGPVFHYSDTWQLVINTGTTIVTFLMVFLIQRAQNKDALALQLKMNELVAATLGARPSTVWWRVTLPLLVPGMVSGAVLAFARSLGEFGATLTFAGSRQGVTRTLPLEIYLQRVDNADAAVALSILLVAVAALVVLGLGARRLTGTDTGGRV